MLWINILLLILAQQEGLSPREYLEFTERERFEPEPTPKEPVGKICLVVLLQWQK